ncbi:hypothetical protein O3I_020255 [Nocardia brasiliensis ATCC 700358]|uniref:Uncharacterized protein n=1 Tax=Nocardia brasiliensis (strain ATCC 700358 / HUJEG-1) TaxID=1133849 RepID=K0EYQ3_NOCB7|nr:hypothetical protein O3I_020255 [Nocardia brasiliensis ATCC 700358]
MSAPPVTKPAPAPTNPPGIPAPIAMPPDFHHVIDSLPTQLASPLPMMLATGAATAPDTAPTAPATKIRFRSKSSMCPLLFWIASTANSVPRPITPCTPPLMAASFHIGIAAILAAWLTRNSSRVASVRPITAMIPAVSACRAGITTAPNQVVSAYAISAARIARVMMTCNLVCSISAPIARHDLPTWRIVSMSFGIDCSPVKNWSNWLFILSAPSPE